MKSAPVVTTEKIQPKPQRYDISNGSRRAKSRNAEMCFLFSTVALIASVKPLQICFNKNKKHAVQNMTKTNRIETRLEICCVLRSVLCRYENNKFAVYQIYSTNLQLGAVGVSRKGACHGLTSINIGRRVGSSRRCYHRRH